MQIRILDDSVWNTWNFDEPGHGPIVSAGTYEVELIKMPTGRPAIVFAHPETIGEKPEDLIGEDEGHLRETIAAGKVKAELITT